MKHEHDLRPLALRGWESTRGEMNRAAKLDEATVLEIRRTAGKVSEEEWAKRTGCNVRTIVNARSGKSWKHLRSE